MMADAYPRRNGFPAAFFLDSKLFQQTQVDLPRIDLLLPQEIVDKTRDIQSIATRYFGSVHLWMPILSTQRFYDHLSNFVSQPSSDRSILIFCMRLVSWLPAEHAGKDKPRTPDYLAAKRFFLEAEISGGLTIQLLQAMTLLTIYEMGHAVYPAAYLSIANCARYGSALGIDVHKSSDPASASFDEMEQEERRRLWWAIVILDRYMNLGCPMRALVAKAPGLKYPLPGEDGEWDKGNPSQHTTTILSSIEASATLGLFAQLARSARLLESIFKLTSTTPVSEQAQRRREQGDRILQACVGKSMVDERLLGIGLSSIAISTSDFNGIKPSVNVASIFGDYVETLMGVKTKPVENQSLFLIHCVYYAAKILQRTNKPGDEETLKVIKIRLATLGKRWMVAGAYLRILMADALTITDEE